MNVVGRVGNLISQGVYAVLIPFHPFGGAIDVIVVQQEDGTFRSTPWHVRFGKFQGVLKGTEKVVRITVNGVEADFHMYLDNSGEAYFVREVDGSEGSDAVDVTNDSIVDDSVNADGENMTDSPEHDIFDTSVHIQERLSSSYSEKNEMAESDGDRRFYFQDEQSPPDNSEVSYYSTNEYENLDIVKSQDKTSEVILESVDDQVLIDPISASEKGMEKVHLTTLECDLGLGDGMDFGEGNEEFDSGENPRPSTYIHQLNVSKTDVEFCNICSANNDTANSEYQLEVCEGDDEYGYVFHSVETRNKDRHVDTTLGINMDRVSNHFLEPSEDSKLGRLDSDGVDSTLTDNNLEVEGIENPSVVNETVEENVTEFISHELSLPSGHDSSNICMSPDLPVTGIPSKEKLGGSENLDRNDSSIYLDSDNTQLKNNPIDEVTTFFVDDVEGGLQRSVDDEGNEIEPLKLCSEKSNRRIDGQQSTKLEISLCGSKFYSGMGLSAAAKAFDAHRISAQEFESSASSIIRNENLIIRFGGSYWHWDKVAPIVLGMAAFGLDLRMDPKDAIPVEQDDSNRPKNEEAEHISTTGSRWSYWPIPFRRVKNIEINGNGSPNEEVFLDSESGLQSPILTSRDSPCKQVTKTNVPTTEQITSLNLKEGQNRIEFTFSTRVLGVQKVDAHIYLWKWNAQIVISDVDGTITKSDVLGQFMPLVGMDWTQSGVARFFSAIKENGYQLLFLSARAIVQAYLTRSFLLNLKQDGEALPDGPVVISPDGLFPSFYREVIRRAPHEFKIACLEEIRKLFPSDHNPFYAGFGNRDTDELSYLKMGIPKGKIFIINPKGEVVNSHCSDVRSYTSLLAYVNEMFPPTSSIEPEDFNSWNYWKMPLPEPEVD